MSAKTSKPGNTGWVFDLGRGSISKSDPKKEKGAAKAPCGSHRFCLAAKVARLFPTYRGHSTGFDPIGFLAPALNKSNA